ncbi:MAG: PAS domain S-box protein [Cyanobacteria bacterium P01_H01_bin.58]
MDGLSPKVLIIDATQADAQLIVRELQHAKMHPSWQQVQTEAALPTAIVNQAWDVVIAAEISTQPIAAQALAIAQRYAPQVPFIVVTDITDVMVAVAMMRNGASDYILRDNLASLPTAVRHVVQKLPTRRTESIWPQSPTGFLEAQRIAHLGNWEFDLQTKIFTWSEEVYRIFDLPRHHQITVETWLSRIHPDDREYVHQAFLDLPECFCHELSYRLQGKDSYVKHVRELGRFVCSSNQTCGRLVGTIQDITPYQQSQLTLKATQTKLKALNAELEARVAQRTAELQASQRFSERLAETTPHLLYIYDLPARQYTYINRKVQGILGYTPEAIQAMGVRSLAQLIHPEDLAQVMEHYHRLSHTQNDQILELEYRMCDRAGNWHWFISHDVVFERDNATGQGTQVLGSAVNITERKAIEAALRRSQERTQATLKAMPDMVFRIDKQNRYLDFFVPEGMTSVAHNPDAVVGETLAASLPADMAQRHRQALRRALTHQTVQVYEQQVQINGCLRYEEVRVAPCGEEEAVFFIRDITDRRQAEQRLKTSEAEFSALFSAISDSIVVRDFTGRCLKIAPQSTNLFLPAEQLLGKTLHETFPQSIADYLLRKLRECLATQTMIPTEYALSIKGQLVHFSANISPLSQEMAVIVARDVSDRKAYEAQLHQTNAELLRATHLKDEFLANMSHELRTPLNAILGMAEGLQENIFGSLSNRQQQSIATIERSGRHLLALINDILDLAKVEAGKMELELAHVPIRTLCETSLSMVRQLAFKKQIRLTLKIAEEAAACSVLVDDRRCCQVLINLLGNAIKFTPQGGSVTLAVERGRAPEGMSKTMNFSVIDTGIGIAPENLNKLFRTFVQIDSRLNRQYGGTGLGLALVKRLTEMHGGEVTVTSQIHEGSCFTVRLPISPQQRCVSDTDTAGNNHKQIAAASTKQSPQGEDKAMFPRVLLVENNEASRYSMGGYLEAKGYRLAFADNDHQAIEKIQICRPDIILINVQMSHMNDLEVTQQIRSLPSCAAMPILVLTALEISKEQKTHLATEATSYLTKPVKLKELVTTIDSLLKGAQYVG